MTELEAAHAAVVETFRRDRVARWDYYVAINEYRPPLSVYQAAERAALAAIQAVRSKSER